MPKKTCLLIKKWAKVGKISLFSVNANMFYLFIGRRVKLVLRVVFAVKNSYDNKSNRCKR
jgi:hypothetical protein